MEKDEDICSECGQSKPDRALSIMKGFLVLALMGLAATISWAFTRTSWDNYYHERYYDGECVGYRVARDEAKIIAAYKKVEHLTNFEQEADQRAWRAACEARMLNIIRERAGLPPACNVQMDYRDE